MNVAELVAFLQTQPQGLPVAYRICSEQCLLEVGDIRVEFAGVPRNDGWIHDPRPDKPVQAYLMFPGN